MPAFYGRPELYDTELETVAGGAGTGIVTITGVGTAAARTLAGTPSQVPITDEDDVARAPAHPAPPALPGVDIE